MGEGLRYWILGQAFVMLVVAITTAGGLALLGISPALILGLQAGLLAFIPNIGPVIAAVPIILAGLAHGMVPALGALGIYVLIQALESYLLTPLIQRRAIDVPPAIIFGGQVVLGVLFGLIGLALAVPLLAIGKVTIDKLYFEGVLGEKKG